MKPIPEDTGSFLAIRMANPQMLYVDKTAYLHRLVTSSRKCLFLARPRRFGKSLMITTLKEIFNGRKDLFEGLAIAKTDWEWKKHPVLHFNFGQCANATGYENFAKSFAARIEAILAEVGCAYDPDKDPGENFGAGIDALAAKAMRGEGELPVILVDEYDDPVAKVLHDVPFAEKVRALLATFYGQLKDRTEKYRFLMITGVSKFTKMSIFSTLSNLIDLSFDDDYAMMLGYTEAELDEYFDDRMHIQAEKMGMTYGSTEETVHEASFARNLQFLLAGQDFRMEPERTTSDGRIDLVADHPCGTYIFELKVDRPAAIAMDQATAKKYAEPYLAPDKPAWLVGLSFERGTRRFVEGVVTKLR